MPSLANRNDHSGRSVSACQRAFNHIRSRHAFPAPSQPPAASQNMSTVPKPRKRPSASDLSTPSHVPTGFSSFPSVNNPPPAHGLPAVSLSPGRKAGKKRGRPSKAEHELRAAEAAARGETYPPPKKIRAPKAPIEHGESTATTGASGDGEAPGGSGASEAMKSPPNLKPQIEPQSALVATANAANQMGESSAPGTQDAQPSASESLLADLQEHAAQTDTKATEATQQQSTGQASAAQVETYPTRQNEPYQTPYQQTSGV